MTGSPIYIKSILIAGLTLLFTLGSVANNTEIDFEKQIEWKDSSKYPELPFEGPGFFKKESGIPVVMVSIPLPANFSPENTDIEIEPLEWAPYAGNLLVDITPGDVAEKPTYRVVHIKKKAWLEIELIPFRVARNQETKWEKLHRFSINVKHSSSTEKSTLKSESKKYSTSSRLVTGHWVKIGTNERGIHKISHSTLESWGFSNPSKVQVFGNGGAMVPMANNEERPDDLPKIGCLHTNNALYFYSPGTWQWNWNNNLEIFEHQLHKYSRMAFFFLSQTDEQIVGPASQPTIEEAANQNTSTYDYLYFHEQELENLLHSGNQWFGEKFNNSITLEETFEVVIPNINHENDLVFYTQVAGRANSNQGFEININNHSPVKIPINTVTLNDYLGYYARVASEKATLSPAGSNDVFNINYRYTNGAGNAIGWIDYFIINARGNLTLENGPINFRDRQVVGPNNITSFQISGATPNTLIWDVSNPREPVQIKTETSGNQAVFKDYSVQLKEYVAFNPSMTFAKPEFIEDTPNQNLHGTPPAEMIIVAPAEFNSQAQRLANLHKQHSNLSVAVADRDQIYNEFSWGHPDPGAIRSFMKMLYDRAGDNLAEIPQLLLLFGDGTYDNRHVDNTPEAPLPTYQSNNSLYQTKTYVTDDFFGFLDNEEGENLRNDRLDIGIGRFPVNNQKQAAAAVDKTEMYLTSQEKGKWKTKLTFIGDDGDFNIHMRDADRLAQKVAQNHPEFNLEKIYFDAYEVASGATGKEFPGVNRDIEKSISEGTLILNYTGHGSENNLAHERIITRSDINGWNNRGKLPLFVTATCEFSRFDNHHLTSAGEEVFLNPQGGGIALLSTTRIVYSSLNYTLNNAFYNHAFETDEKGLPLRLGEMMRRTKIESGSNTNKLNFTLLGDPALRLTYPAKNVATMALNEASMNEKADTIKALSKNKLTAEVQNPLGEKINDFNGTAQVTVFDKAVEIKTLGNENNTPFTYKDFSNILFKGRTTITNGEFSIEFVVPQDIRYNFDNGRISYFAIAGDGREAAGAFNNVVVGGISNNTESDTKGPEMDMYLNHAGFKSRDKTNPRPMLYANVFDESGINTSGIGIGHNITLIIDGDTNNPLVLNDAFTADIDDYKAGTIEYQLPNMEEGNHEIILKVWDNYNNSSTASLQFRVSKDHGLQVREFSASPNPVKPGEDVYITMKTDAPNTTISSTIQFINSAGAVTGTVKDELISSGNLIGPYRLPLEQSGWDYSGICFVRVIFKTQNGKETSVVAKLVPAP